MYTYRLLIVHLLSQMIMNLKHDARSKHPSEPHCTALAWAGGLRNLAEHRGHVWRSVCYLLRLMDTALICGPRATWRCNLVADAVTRVISATIMLRSEFGRNIGEVMLMK